MEYVEHTSSVLNNFVLANSSTRALKIDFPPFLRILLHMIDFMYMYNYKFILSLINFLHKLKYRMR